MELATYREYTCPFCRAISKFLSQHQICDSFVTLRIVPELELESDAYTSNEILCSLNIMLSPFYTCITGLSGRLVDPAKLPQKKMETKPDLGSDWQIGMLTIGLYVAAGSYKKILVSISTIY
jgi:hypothetical protein